jgi:oligopeptide/dipeptide ABC transporter ATP-binding protein
MIRDERKDRPPIVLSASGICVRHIESGRLLVDRVDLSIGRGEITCLVGESGSGKSLTMRALIGLVPRNLRVEMPHFEMAYSNGRARDRLAFIPQRALSALNPLLRIGTQLVECAAVEFRRDGNSAESTAIRLLEEVGLDSPARRMRQYPHELSGGQRQRVLTAMALIRAPAVIVADEPTTALDVGSQNLVLQLLRERCRSAGLGIILVTHDLSVAASVADRIVVMYSGQIVEQGAAPTVLAKPLHPYTRALLACTPIIGADGRAALPQPIPGQMRTREATASGCAFEGRCRSAELRCREGEVSLESRSSGHQVRCILQ